MRTRRSRRRAAPPTPKSVALPDSAPPQLSAAMAPLSCLISPRPAACPSCLARLRERSLPGACCVLHPAMRRTARARPPPGLSPSYDGQQQEQQERSARRQHRLVQLWVRGWLAARSAQECHRPARRRREACFAASRLRCVASVGWRGGGPPVRARLAGGSQHTPHAQVPPWWLRAKPGRWQGTWRASDGLFPRRESATAERAMSKRECVGGYGGGTDHSPSTANKASTISPAVCCGTACASRAAGAASPAYADRVSDATLSVVRPAAVWWPAVEGDATGAACCTA